MASLSQRQAAPPNPASGQTQLAPASRTQTQPAAILRLRGGHTTTGRSVQWSEDTVDNEGLGRKTSKVCCIYHKPKGVDESSDESSSDSSSSSSDSESDGGGPSSAPPRKQRAGGGKGKRDGGKKKHAHDCDKHDHDHDHGDGRRRPPGQGDGSSRRRRTSPNAYEKVPKYKPKDQGDGGSQKVPKPAS